MDNQHINLLHYGASQQGLVRGENQDAFLDSGSIGLFAVADGMGGLPGGRRASIQALNSLRRFFEEHPDGDLSEAFLFAHRAVQRVGKLVSPRYGIGTTLSVLLWRPPILHLVHVGDSVIYHITDASIRMLTEDHVQERVKIVNRTTTFAAELTAYVGQADPLEPQCCSIIPAAGDCFLLATDGITKQIDEREIHIVATAQKTPEGLVEGLNLMANLRGGEDNATALALYFGK